MNLEKIVSVSAPSLCPQGRWAVIAASHPSFAADSDVGQLWLIDTTDQVEPRRITQGVSDSAPQFSPDGARIAFLRTVDGTSQLAVMDARGGEARVITKAPLGVTGFTWDRSSTLLALTAPMPQHGRYGTVKGVTVAAEDPRRITTNKYKLNGRGYIHDKPLGLYVLAAPPLDEAPYVSPIGRAAEALTASAKDDASSKKKAKNGTNTADAPQMIGGKDGMPAALLVSPADSDAHQPEFSPDGDWLYFTAALHDNADNDLLTSIYRVNIGAHRTELTRTPVGEKPSTIPAPPEVEVAVSEPTVAFSAPRFSTDGAWLFMLGSDLGKTGTDFVARMAGVCVVDASTLGSDHVTVTARTDRDLVEYGATHRFEPAGPNTMFALASVRGSVEVHRVPARGKVRTVVSGQRVVTGVAAAAQDPEVIVASFTDPTTPGELGRVEVVKNAGVIRALTTFAAPLTADTPPVMPRELIVKSDDGYPVHGWVYIPDGPGPHPVLLNIHGGPFAEYTWAWFDEAQTYVNAGYAVVQCNPRGSNSYGREHGLAIKGQMGTLDFQDVMAFLNGALKSSKRLDKKRLGVAGGSYGGYLTAWIIAHDHRFSAALVERGYLDPASFIGTSDIGWFFSPEYTGTDPAQMEAQSPFAFAENVQTPTLVLHSEEDLRCPLDQAERYFAKIRAAGVEAEMLIFPGETHELSRSGRPWHRQQRFDAILEWFGRYLQK